MPGLRQHGDLALIEAPGAADRHGCVPQPGFCRRMLFHSLGMGLYGAAYLLPVLLGLIRNYDALAIGEFIMVTGAAQLVMAPVATILERHVDKRLLIFAGYALLTIGFVGNGFMTFETDFWGLFWQQIIRAGIS
jgi:MFS transporter, DHA2 family, multidrug resistance protein